MGNYHGLAANFDLGDARARIGEWQGGRLAVLQHRRHDMGSVRPGYRRDAGLFQLAAGRGVRLAGFYRS